VVDTDVIAREVVEPGSPALNKVAETFGPQVLDESGDLNRRYLRELVFSDRGSKQQLEAILHPAIAAAVRQKIAALEASYCILVVPLLAESGRYRITHWHRCQRRNPDRAADCPRWRQPAAG
jgi:dephospho-CoA kinase